MNSTIAGSSGRSAVAVVLFSAVLALGGCAEAEPAAPVAREAPATAVAGAFLGRADAGDVFVAVVPGDTSIRVYACDGADLFHATVDQWFEGPFDGTGPVTLTAGGAKVTLRATEEGYRGELVTSRQSMHFTAAPPAIGSALLDAKVRDPQTGVVTRDGTVIVIGGDQRGALVPTRPRKCRFILVSGPNGAQQWVSVCG